MKTTRLLQAGTSWNLVRHLRGLLGEPTYLEELAIYLRDQDDFKITITREHLELVWNDDTGTTPGRLGTPRQRLFMDPASLKTKLLFLARMKGNTGHISVVPILRFRNEELGTTFDIRPQSSVGETVAISVPDHVARDAELLAGHDAFVAANVAGFVTDDLAGRISALEPVVEEFIDLDSSDRGLLNSKILDFCKRNGIVGVKAGATYRSTLEGRSNDYSFLEQLFRELTRVELLARHSHCEVPGNYTISIIIPCYNAENTIERTLASIASQAVPEGLFANIEVLLIDDASRLPLRDVLTMEDYPFRCEVLTLSKNHGVSHARHLGVMHATGSVLMFLDADVLLSAHYLSDHLARNAMIGHAVFVSFKENVSSDDDRITTARIAAGLPLPAYRRDLRIQKTVVAGAVGNYEVARDREFTILEDSNFFKDFGSRVFGVYDLSCMVTGHNFTLRRSTALAVDPFIPEFRDSGWGMEDVVLGLKALARGCYIIPVLSAGVYHIDHAPRSGSEEAKRAEYRANTRRVEALLDRPVVES
jgi:GT2 family glycosyltransferase